MFISFYITDTKNSLIFQYLLSSSSPPFAHLWAKVQAVCPELSIDHCNENPEESSGDQSPLGYSRSVHGSLGKDLEIYKYHSLTNRMNYFCLTSHSQGEASIEPFIFLEDMDRLLLEYFEKDRLTLSKLTNNHDRLAMIFYMCVDAGEPSVGRLHENMIKQMVPIRSDLSKIINSTANSIQKAVQRQPSSKNSGFFEQPASLVNDNNSYEDSIVPWRSGNLKYKENEIYVDMVETIHLVYSKRQKRRKPKQYKDQNMCVTEMVCGSICGAIDFRSHLSENPKVEIDLDLAGNYLGVPSLHRSVEIPHEDIKDLDKLRFVPPDGKFCLMEYVIDLDTPQAKKAGYNHVTVGMLSVDFQDGLGKKQDEFEITINISSSMKVSNIKDLRVEVEVSPEVRTELNCENELKRKSQDQEPHEVTLDSNDYKINVLRNTHGRFENSVVPGKGIWIFDQDTAVGALPVFRGCVESVEDHNSSSSPFCIKVKSVSVSYNYSGQLASGIQINAINIISGIRNLKHLNLFKGVKYYTKAGDFEIRGESSIM